MPAKTASALERYGGVRAIALLVMLALGGLYFIYAVNLWVDEGETDIEMLRIELDEALLYGMAMTVALCCYATWLYWSRQRQHGRQLAAMAQARRIGETDPLTGLANRRRFDTALAALLDAAPRGGCAVLMIDLDGFKAVNDEYGHAAGDEVLRVVARRIAAAVRGDDLAIRLGGDEFAVLAPATADAAAARAIADRITASIAEPIAAGAAVHHVEASIGIALSGGEGSATLVEAADAALYAAKRAGGAIRFAGRTALVEG